jgi:hypothetical protein
MPLLPPVTIATSLVAILFGVSLGHFRQKILADGMKDIDHDGPLQELDFVLHIAREKHNAARPKYAVSQVIGFIKGKSAIHLAGVYGERKRNFVGQHFWARGYWVSTRGRDEAEIREYIRNPEQEDQCLDQMGLWR